MMSHRTLTVPGPRLLTAVIGATTLSAIGTGAAAICLKQYSVSCAFWYIQPPDGCDDIVSGTSPSSYTAVPISDVPGYGWTQSTPTTCTADIQKRIPDGEGGCMDGEFFSQSQINGGSQGSGSACELSGGGDD